jgi:hypothetical protein
MSPSLFSIQSGLKNAASDRCQRLQSKKNPRPRNMRAKIIQIPAWANNADGFTFSTVEIFWIVRSEIFSSPRSTPPMYVRLISASSASCSCEIPCRFRSSRKDSPKRRRTMFRDAGIAAEVYRNVAFDTTAYTRHRGTELFQPSHPCNETCCLYCAWFSARPPNIGLQPR